MLTSLHKLSLSSDSAEKTIKIANKIGQNLKGGEVILLNSDLGGGKTTFTKGLSSGLGSTELVTSPSFTICNEYRSGDKTIYHFDFFRLNNPGIMSQELEEYLDDPDGIIVIEWPNIVIPNIPDNRVTIEIISSADDSREFNIIYSDNLKYLFEGVN